MSVKYYDLENKRVFVTGGGSGIGASIVEHFCEQNSEVYFVDINGEESNKLISDIKNKNFKIPTFIKCDLLNIKQLQNTISFLCLFQFLQLKEIFLKFLGYNN